MLLNFSPSPKSWSVIFRQLEKSDPGLESVHQYTSFSSSSTWLLMLSRVAVELAAVLVFLVLRMYRRAAVPITVTAAMPVQSTALRAPLLLRVGHQGGMTDRGGSGPACDTTTPALFKSQAKLCKRGLLHLYFAHQRGCALRTAIFSKQNNRLPRAAVGEVLLAAEAGKAST